MIRWALLLPLAALLAWPAGAAGHAVLTHSTPHRGATVETAPPEVQFDFNEAVEASFGSVRVYDENGDQVDDGDIHRPGGSSISVAVGLEDGLGDGVYTGTYRVVSADGHPVSGGFSFGVGEALPTGGSAPSVAELLEDTDAGDDVEGAYGVVRGLHYASLLFLIGAAAGGRTPLAARRDRRPLAAARRHRGRGGGTRLRAARDRPAGAPRRGREPRRHLRPQHLGRRARHPRRAMRGRSGPPAGSWCSCSS